MKGEPLLVQRLRSLGLEEILTGLLERVVALLELVLDVALDALHQGRLAERLDLRP